MGRVALLIVGTGSRIPGSVETRVGRLLRRTTTLSRPHTRRRLSHRSAIQASIACHRRRCVHRRERVTGVTGTSPLKAHVAARLSALVIAGGVLCTTSTPFPRSPPSRSSRCPCSGRRARGRLHLRHPLHG